MTVGEWMLYGGMAGTVISLTVVFVALKIFNRRRKKALQKIMESL